MIVLEEKALLVGSMNIPLSLREEFKRAPELYLSSALMQRDLLADENSFMSMRCFSRLNLRKIYRILDNFSSLNAVIDLECFVVIGTCLY